MDIHRLRALGSLPLTVPAWALCVFSLARREPPRDLVSPPLVLGGLLGAVSLNVQSICRFRLACRHGALSASLSVRVRRRLLNFLLLGWACLPLAALAGYVFLENIARR